eukprot:1043447-Prymnesium_polylepis.1
MTVAIVDGGLRGKTKSYGTPMQVPPSDKAEPALAVSGDADDAAFICSSKNAEIPKYDWERKHD